MLRCQNPANVALTKGKFQTEPLPTFVIAGMTAFAVSAAFALLHGFLATKCLGHQLTISRYLGRLEGDRWDDRAKESFKDVIRYQQREQKFVLKAGNAFLVTATIALIGGAALVAACSVLILFGK
jgi:hypothetical protein